MISRAQFIGLGVLGAMGDGFNNPVVKNNGGLVIPSIHSPNFIHNVSGWSINKDGTAEFQNIIARGDIQANSFTGNNFRFTANGEFFYKAAPALGTLVLSITNDNYVGDDGLGNTVQGGTTSYVDNGVSFDAVNFQGGTLNFFNAPAANGAYTLEASIGYAAGTALEIVTQLAGGAITIGPAATGDIVLGTNLASGKIQALTNLLISLADNNPIIDIENLQSAPTNPTFRLKGVNFSDGAFSLRRSGDGNNAFRINVDGTIKWGPGTAGQDTTLYRDSAGLIGTDPLGANIAGTSDVWHSLGALGAHYTVNYAKYKMGVEREVLIDFNVTGDGLQAATVTFANTLPAAYRPSTARNAMPLGSTRAVNAGDTWPRWSCDAAGNVSVTVQPVNGISYATHGTAHIALDL